MAPDIHLLTILPNGRNDLKFIGLVDSAIGALDFVFEFQS